MKKKLMALLGVCVLTVGAAAGCGSSGGSNETTGSAAVSESAEAQAETAAEDSSEEAQAAEEESESEEEGVRGVAGAWVDITEDEARQLVTRLFKAPEGAEVLGWMKCEELGDPDTNLSPVVELTFSMDGNIFSARAQQGAPEDAEISGAGITEWTVGPEDVTLANWGGGNMTGKTYRAVTDNGYTDLITWYDIEIGIAYSLTVSAADLDGFDIQAVAEQMYAPENEPEIP